MLPHPFSLFSLVIPVSSTCVVTSRILAFFFLSSGFRQFLMKWSSLPHLKHVFFLILELSTSIGSYFFGLTVGPLFPGRGFSLSLQFPCFWCLLTSTLLLNFKAAFLYLLQVSGRSSM